MAPMVPHGGSPWRVPKGETHEIMEGMPPNMHPLPKRKLVQMMMTRIRISYSLFGVQQLAVDLAVVVEVSGMAIKKLRRSQ